MGTHAVAVALYPNLAYDPAKDFEPIGLLASTPVLVLARNNFPAQNLKEFVGYLRENASSLNMAHAGNGSSSHVTCLLLNHIVGAKPTMIPYSGMAPAMNALIGRQVDYMCDVGTNAVPQIRGGTIKAYAVATPMRNPALPELPTSAGSPDEWTGIGRCAAITGV
jgi:tripartite-type tricarboxylate transporter receptor subunit TctC